MEFKIATTLWVVQLGIVLIPWLFATISTLGTKQVIAVAKYAPHQYFFMLGAYPICSFLAIMSLTIALSRFPTLLPTPSYQASLSYYTTPIIFGAFAISSAVVIGDHFLAGRSIDKLNPPELKQALSLVREIEDKDSERDPGTKDRDIRAEQNQARDSFEVFIERPSRENLERLRPRAKLRALLDGRVQQNLRLVDPRLALTSHIQVFAVVFVALISLLCGLLAFSCLRIPNPTKELSSAIADVYGLTILSFAAMAIHPICFATYRAKLDDVVAPPLPFSQHIFVGIVLVLAIAFFVTTDPTKSLSIEFFASRVAPVIVAGGIGLLGTSKDASLLQRAIGWDSSAGSNFIVLVILWVVSCLSFLLSIK